MRTSCLPREADCGLVSVDAKPCRLGTRRSDHFNHEYNGELRFRLRKRETFGVSNCSVSFSLLALASLSCGVRPTT